MNTEKVIDQINETMNNDIGNNSNLTTENKTDLVSAINEIFQSGDTVKQEIVTILLAKGLEATTDMTFSELIDCFDDLTKAQGSAVAANVLSGKTFINSTGELVTGTMTNNGSKSITPNASTQTLPAGYYSGVTINGDSDLKAANIKSGVNIFGVTGNAVETYVDTGEYSLLSDSSGSNTWNYSYKWNGAGEYMMSDAYMYPTFGFRFNYISGNVNLIFQFSHYYSALNQTILKTVTIKPGEDFMFYDLAVPSPTTGVSVECRADLISGSAQVTYQRAAIIAAVVK